jgi:NitT/TauT family transport system permease protein
VRFRMVESLLTPPAVAVNAIPIVVIVPILNNMLFGTTSQVPRRLMVMLIVFFVVFVNVAKGLRQVSATHLELMRSYAATPSEILYKVRVPNAVGYLFTAMRIAAPLAVITAFVAEYFGGVQSGLATGVRNSLNGSKDVTWAYVIGASVLGLTFYLVSSGLERLHGGRKNSG